MRKLNLMSVDKKPISGVHGSQIVDLVLITVELPNGVIKKNVKVAVCNMTANADVIIGMDIISLGDFAISNGNEQTLFSFAVPPFKEKTDFSKKQYEE